MSSRLMEARRVLALKRPLSCHDGLEQALVDELGGLQGQVLELNHDLAESRDASTKLGLAIEQYLAGDISGEALAEIWRGVVEEAQRL